MTKKILVLGGYGRIGRQLLLRLRDEPGIACVLGGRDATRGAQEAGAVGAEFAQVDVTRATSVGAALEEVFAVVHTAGPFQWRDYGVAAACARRGIHYLDLANVHAFITGVSALDERARESGACILSGAGLSPALSGALADELATAFDQVDSITVTLCSDGIEGPAGIRALFSEAGRPVRFLQSGHWREALAGLPAGRARFSLPIGERRVYYLDAADLELFPTRFGSVGMRYEVAYAPRLMGFLHLAARLKSYGALTDSERLAQLAGRFANAPPTPTAGIRVSMRGRKAEHAVRREIELMAPGDAALLSSAPVLALLRRWVSGQRSEPGARPALGAIAFSDIKSVLSGTGALLSIA